MNDIESFEISLPTDVDGYVLMKCPSCGTHFKLKPEDINDEGFLYIFCPCCGLTSDNYITDDAMNQARIKAENFAYETLQKDLQKFNQSLSKSFIKMNMEIEKPKLSERSVLDSEYALQEVYFPCCRRKAKVKLLLKMTGCYCPFCGVKDYETDSN